MTPRPSRPSVLRPIACLMPAVVVLVAGGCAALPGSGSREPAIAMAARPPLAFADTVTLRNGHIAVGVSPRVGRIVHFGRVKGPNLLWIAPDDAYQHPYRAGDRRYVNVGGDKVWPTVQALWQRAYGDAEWPPEGVIDGRPWELLEHTDRRVTIRSEVAPTLGVRILRTVELAADEPRIDITNTIERVEANVFPVHLWSITQTVNPAAVMLDVADDRVDRSRTWVRMGGEIDAFVHTVGDDDAVLWRLDQEGDAKLGTLGRWVAGLYADTVFLQSTEYDPRGAYPDASSAQVYSSAAYTELELLSPFVHLLPGETLENRVTWRLLDRPAGATPEGLYDLLTEAAGARE